MGASLLILLLSTIVLVHCKSTVVKTKYGDIEGTFDGVSRAGKRFYQFRGIQYAVVSERFKPAIEPSSWNRTKPATKFGHGCDNIESHGDENCLFLNVYTRQLGLSSKGTKAKPVIVYIHGGSFKAGNGHNQGPNYYMDEDLVFVSINYRLGLLGFLSTGDEASPGNYGLKDQVLALKWVRSNIQEFGGDPNKVTISGNSAGSASVTYHLVSPMSQGLFQRAVAQSGTFLDPWAFTRKPFRYAKKTADVLHCPDTNSSVAIVACLKTFPAEVLSQTQLLSKVTLKFFRDPLAGFGPTIEPIMKGDEGQNSFLSESPYEILLSGRFNKVPLLTGLVKEEGIYIWATALYISQESRAIAERTRLYSNWSEVAPEAFYFKEKISAKNLPQTAKAIEKFYFGNSSGFTLDDMGTFSKLAQLYSDRLFVASGIRFMNLYAKHAPTYPYLYTFNKDVGIEYGLEWEDLHRSYKLDATHCSELDMFFSPLFNIVKVVRTLDHDDLSKNMVKLWASFIDGGVPSASFGSERSFPSINGSRGLEKFYRLDSDTEQIDNIFADRIGFWESLGLSDNDFFNCYNC